MIRLVYSKRVLKAQYQQMLILAFISLYRQTYRQFKQVVNMIYRVYRFKRSRASHKGLVLLNYSCGALQSSNNFRLLFGVEMNLLGSTSESQVVLLEPSCSDQVRSSLIL